MRYVRRWMSVVLVAAIVLAPSGAARADLFDRLMGKSTYKTFEHKFIDSKVATDAIAAPLKPSTENGRINGSPIWDAVSSPQMQVYANGIMQRLLAGWQGPKPPIRLLITANSGLEAYSTAAGVIYFARGWFEKCDSEDQVAAILAHELSHILLNHFARDEAKEGMRLAVAGAASAAVTAFTVGSMRPQVVNQQLSISIEDQKKLHNNLQNTILIKFAIDEVSSFAVNAAWARVQEDEADLLAIDLLAKAQYNVNGLPTALERLADWETVSEKRFDQLDDSYKTALAQALQTGNAANVKAVALDVIKGKLLDIANEARKKLLHNHPSTKARIDETRAYISREYEDADSKQDMTKLRTFRDSKAVKPVLANHTLSEDAQKKLLADALAEARPLAAKGISGPTAGAPYPLRVMAMTELKGGDVAGGLKHMQRASDSPDASFATVMMLVGDYADAKNFKQAHAVLDRAAVRFGSAEATYPTAIKLALKEGHNADAAAILKTCKQVKNDDLIDQCRLSSGETCVDSQIICAFSQSPEGITDFLGGLLSSDKSGGTGVSKGN